MVNGAFVSLLMFAFRKVRDVVHTDMSVNMW